MADIPVCNQHWNGVKNESFKWNNNTNSTVTISQIPNTTWPFTLPSPIVINSNQKLECGLISTTGTYPYNASPCTTLGNPRNVVIS